MPSMSKATTGGDDDEVSLNTANTMTNVTGSVSTQEVGMSRCKGRFWNVCALQLYNRFISVQLSLSLTISKFLSSFAIILPAPPPPPSRSPSIQARRSNIEPADERDVLETRGNFSFVML